MNRYIMTSEVFRGFILFTYDGFLVGLEVHANMEQAQFEFLYSQLPVHHNNFKAFQNLVGKKGTAKVVPYKSELGFDTFWEAYNYKIGNKKRAERYWKSKMNNSERHKAIFHIKKYDMALRLTPHIQKLYPDTYLTQARWNN